MKSNCLFKKKKQKRWGNYISNVSLRSIAAKTNASGDKVCLGKGWRHFENTAEWLNLKLVHCTHLLRLFLCYLFYGWYPNAPATQFLYTGYLILLHTVTSVYGLSSSAIGKYEETYKWPLYIKFRKSVRTNRSVIIDLPIVFQSNVSLH